MFCCLFLSSCSILTHRLQLRKPAPTRWPIVEMPSVTDERMWEILSRPYVVQNWHKRRMIGRHPSSICGFAILAYLRPHVTVLREAFAQLGRVDRKSSGPREELRLPAKTQNCWWVISNVRKQEIIYEGNSMAKRALRAPVCLPYLLERVEMPCYTEKKSYRTWPTKQNVFGKFEQW